ncbi:dihydrolipoamide dehydrogenase [Mycoplasmoides fastidiosum]|uniref:Dihydrolipoyl dehydrogenase n=1 Tax=Mycoplasmoides fastidiosum TaxID=92758 RepID=A0ABU0LYX5_9BACT|nr:dihydrolipoyl dehydrogenase [Mycoplasmoides fastidiosum]MDQ0513894.1 dihydrolipoamide dehydrogenase [Mycoplasmoides fastidiosum]UUD37692.1 dihydrolipoyl dehydrogenase [Mycoplasmoides fastidiosum]
MSQYDVIVIGAGPGGYQTAVDAAKLGMKVLVIEKDELGGVCLNTGCIPTKTLLKIGKSYTNLKKAGAYGLNLDPSAVTIDWSKSQARKADVVKKLTSGIGFLFKSNKVDLERGEAVVLNPTTVKVNGKEFQTKFIIAATGSSPRMLPLPGFEQSLKDGFVITSTEALSLPVIPKELVIIGGGVIGIEFAFLYSDLGTKVTIVQGLDRILEVLDQEISATITDILKKKGVEIITNAKVLSAENRELKFEVNGQTQSLKPNHVLVSVGRKINYAGLEALNLAQDERGVIKVDDQLRTSVPNVFLVGDAVGKVMLAHVAYKHGAIVLDAMHNRATKIDYLKVPSCIYSHPEVGTVGYTEEQLKEKGIDYLKHKIPMAALGKALADDSTVGFAKLLVGKKYGEILGCHIVAETASDMIAEIALAMESELVIEDLAKAIHPHPTISEIIQEIAKDLYFKHFYKTA